MSPRRRRGTASEAAVLVTDEETEAQGGRRGGLAHRLAVRRGLPQPAGLSLTPNSFLDVAPHPSLVREHLPCPSEPGLNPDGTKAQEASASGRKTTLLCEPGPVAEPLWVSVSPAKQGTVNQSHGPLPGVGRLIRFLRHEPLPRRGSEKGLCVPPHHAARPQVGGDDPSESDVFPSVHSWAVGI